MPARLTREFYLKGAATKHVRILSDFDRGMDEVDTECLVCGHREKRTVRNVLWYGCPACSRASQRGSYRRTESDFDAKLKKMRLVRVGKYRGTGGNVQVQCRVCGHAWTTRGDTIFAGHGCQECYHNRRKLIEQDVDRRLKAKGIKRLGPYTGARNRLRVRCLTCGHRWAPLASSLCSKSSRRGCPVCSRTKGEP